MCKPSSYNCVWKQLFLSTAVNKTYLLADIYRNQLLCCGVFVLSFENQQFSFRDTIIHLRFHTLQILKCYGELS